MNSVQPFWTPWPFKTVSQGILMISHRNRPQSTNWKSKPPVMLIPFSPATENSIIVPQLLHHPQVLCLQTAGPGGRVPNPTLSPTVSGSFPSHTLAISRTTPSLPCYISCRYQGTWSPPWEQDLVITRIIPDAWRIFNLSKEYFL